MSNYDPDQANGTLVAATVTTVNLAAGTETAIKSLRVINRNGAAEIWWTFEDSSGTLTATAPTVAKADTYFLPAAVSVDVVELPAPMKNIQVKLISSGTPTYTVIGDRF